jgi:predicted transcriptional regulator
MLDPKQATTAAEMSAEEEAALEQLADREFADGAGIPLEEAVAWVRSWFTPNERPAPKARKLD